MQTTDAQLLVLCALARGPLHGYAVNAAIGELTGERLGRGSLSGALARLEAKRLIEALDEQGRQRPLRLTSAGRRLLEQEMQSTARITQRMFEAAVPDRLGYQERLAATGAARAYRRVALEALDARPGHRALELGCRAGTTLGDLAGAVTGPGGGTGSGGSTDNTVGGGTGWVLGVEQDALLAARARAADRAPGRAPVTVLLGDPARLPLRTAAVDRARTDRLLQHAPDPGRVLAEARRVLRPGGRLVLAEPDWESLAFDHPDTASSRAYTRHLVDRIVRNALIGRQSARLAAQAGFEVSAVVPVTSVLRDAREADRILGLQRNAERAVAAGYLPAEAAQRWLDGLAEGPFLAALTLYVTVADVPR